MKNAEQLDQLAAWPVSIGYFEPGSDKKDAVPVYELSFLFFENGVSRKLFIDYGEFAIQGELKEIVFHPPSKCEQKSTVRGRTPRRDARSISPTCEVSRRLTPIDPTATRRRARRRRLPTPAA